MASSAAPPSSDTATLALVIELTVSALTGTLSETMMPPPSVFLAASSSSAALTLSAPVAESYPCLEASTSPTFFVATVPPSSCEMPTQASTLDALLSLKSS